IAAAKETWRSPIYSFFKTTVTIKVHNGRVAHFFTCSAKNCKTEARGMQCYQDKGDKSLTANLRHHAVRCFGEDGVNATMKGEAAGSQSGSIFNAFAHQGQRPVKHSNRAYTSLEFRYVYNCNRPANIISDPELITLFMTGHPHLKISSPNTVRHDVKAAYLKCRERIGKLLQDHYGRLHFATDGWTSTNHCMFVTWTVHLEHNGTMLAFLLDILEVPESHTGMALVCAF
ncbi:hypothetical protein DFH94DRAFT_616566, partial [Russula ochroleuca]